MRTSILAIAVAVLLAGCGKTDETGNTATLDESLTAADFAANDATAIDAATGADANMAADVDINAFESNSGGSNGQVSAPAVRRQGTAETASSATKNRDDDAGEDSSEPAEPTAETNIS